MTEQKETVREALVGIQGRTGAYKNEENVRLAIVARLLYSLGWDIWNPDEVGTEMRTREDKTIRADITLSINKKFNVIFEIKKPESKLDDSVDQLGRYSEEWMNQFSVGVLTNGLLWRFYHLGARSVVLKDRCFKTLDIASDDLDKVTDSMFELLSKDAISKEAAYEKTIQKEWSAERKRRKEEKAKAERDERDTDRESKIAEVVARVSSSLLSHWDDSKIADQLKGELKHVGIGKSWRKAQIQPLIERVKSGSSAAASASQLPTHGKADIKQIPETSFFKFKGHIYNIQEYDYNLLVQIAELVYKEKGKAEFVRHIKSLKWFSQDKTNLNQKKGVLVGKSGYYVGIHGSKHDIARKTRNLLKRFDYSSDSYELPDW